MSMQQAVSLPDQLEQAKPAGRVTGVGEAQLRRLLDALPIGVALMEARTYRRVVCNAACEAMLGPCDILDDTLLNTLAGRMFDEDGRRLLEAENPVHLAAVTGEQAACECFLARVSGERRWTRIVSAPTEDGGEGPAMIKVALIDMEEQHRLLQLQRVLTAELSHRVKNSLAVVSAIASQTMVHAKSMQDFQVSFEGRLSALASAHSLLLERHWAGLSLRELVQTIAAPFDRPGRIEIDGLDVSLTDKQGISLALVLHELATNASKYGALRSPHGRLSIDWDIEGGGAGQRVAFRWEERALESGLGQGQAGMGKRLIRFVVANELRGALRERNGEDWLSCHFDFPVLSPHLPAALVAAA